MSAFHDVVEEFVALLEDTGLAFPAGVEGALGLMDGHISTTAASRLRRLAGTAAKADPWDILASLPPERLLPVLTTESTEVAAVMLSKLPVPKSAELLTQLPGDQARRIAYAISLTGGVDPETVRRIGAARGRGPHRRPEQRCVGQAAQGAHASRAFDRRTRGGAGRS